jgi:hypothetical protein
MGKSPAKFSAMAIWPKRVSNRRTSGMKRRMPGLIRLKGFASLHETKMRVLFPANSLSNKSERIQ